MKPAPFEYHRPGTLDEALALLADDPDAKPLAGGQSLVPMLNFRLARPSALVDLGGISGLEGIRVEDGALVVGAMTRQWDLEHSARCVPAAAGRASARRAHGDPLPRDGRRLARPRRPDRRAARLRARARCRARHEPANDPGGRVLRLRVHDRARAGRAGRRGSLPGADGSTAFAEVAHRDGDFAVVCVARAGDRIALGGVGATPVLWDGGDLDPTGDLFAPVDYKRGVAEALIERVRA